MGSTSSKTIGTETIDKQTETVGGFHIVEVINNKSEKDEDYFVGLKIIIFTIIFTQIFLLNRSTALLLRMAWSVWSWGPYSSMWFGGAAGGD